jgi:prophage regulatory protein
MHIEHDARIAPLREVIRRVNHGKSWVYSEMAAGRFPRQVRVGGRVGWLSTEIDQYIAARIAERDAALGGCGDK